MLAVAMCAGAAEKAVPTGDTVKGEVLEVIDANGFTYLRLKTKDGEFWASVTKTTVSKGSEVTVENVMVMKDFKSKSLNRTFPVILLGNLPGAAPANANPHASGGGAANPHTGMNMSKAPADAADVKVPKANVIGEVGKGYRIAIETLNEGRIAIGAHIFSKKRFSIRDRNLVVIRMNFGKGQEPVTVAAIFYESRLK